MATQLVPLPDVERLSASVVRILGGNPGKFTLQGTNTYLVGRGQHRILIDTGEGKPQWASTLRSVLQQEQATVHKALITHWHGDHVGGIPDLLKLCPHATVHKHEPEDGQSGIDDGETFVTEGATLRAHHTPGHTGDHMVFVLEEEDAMFTGDNVLGHGTAVYENLKVYLSSLHKMRDRFPVSGRAYPGHGPVIESATERITEYIQHRQQREEEIVRVLRYGRLDVEMEKEGGNGGEKEGNNRTAAWTPLELVRVIYRDVPEGLHLPAAYGVMQVLMKLEDEGRVVHESRQGDGEGRWRLKKRREEEVVVNGSSSSSRKKPAL